jgi:cysteine desulfurase / selenocysteine lyase
MNIQNIRTDFPILNQKIQGNPLIYFDNSATTQKPKQVINRIIEFYSEINGNVHRSGHYLSERSSISFESARKKVKDFINAKKSEEIIFTSGTTESINIVASSFGKKFIHSGDEIIITEMEHYSNFVPWQILCNEKHAKLKIIPLNNAGDLQITQLKQLITDKTKLIALTFVSNVLGTINPVKEIIKLAHGKNVPVLIDAAQAVQHIPIDVQDIDCDFFVFSGHKMYAETGLGVLYAKQKWLEIMSPCMYGGGMINKVSFEKTTFADPPYKFEAGTGNISAALSLAEAIDYINNIGIRKIQDHENELVRYAIDQLSSLKRLSIYGDPKQRCGIISFNLQDIHHYDVMMILDKMGIAVRSGKHCAEPLMNHYNIKGCVRASFAVYNSKEEIDGFLIGLKKVQEIYK